MGESVVIVKNKGLWQFSCVPKTVVDYWIFKFWNTHIVTFLGICSLLLNYLKILKEKLLGHRMCFIFVCSFCWKHGWLQKCICVPHVKWQIFLSASNKIWNILTYCSRNPNIKFHENPFIHSLVVSWIHMVDRWNGFDRLTAGMQVCLKMTKVHLVIFHGTTDICSLDES